MRNELMHKGDPNVGLVHAIGKPEACHLEDMVERYLSYRFFGDVIVYPSRWFPGRAPKPSDAP
jgi:hypothetical protein